MDPEGNEASEDAQNKPPESCVSDRKICLHTLFQTYIYVHGLGSTLGPLEGKKACMNLRKYY